jgi:glyceraldehyde-3-phosphate dehydrogenase (NADP+)
MNNAAPARLQNLPFPQVPEIHGRVLIGGRLMSEGFERKKVYSNSSLPNSASSENGTYLGETPHIDGTMFMAAVEAARSAWSKGQGAWPTARMEERVAAVLKFRDKMLAEREIISRLLMWEIGKNWADAQSEFDRTIVYINDTIEEVKKLDRDSNRFQFAGGLMAQIRRAPLGVTLCMGPFNYPLNETFTTLIPALIMGNTVIVKVSRYGELFWDCLLEAFNESFPAGVVNIINGRGREIVGNAVKTGKIDVLAFIGSSRVANQIKLEHPQPHRFRSILALEAKNPAIILSDADMEIAVAECLKGSLSFNGQRCTAIKMILVHKSRAEEFTKKFVEKVEALPRSQSRTRRQDRRNPLPSRGGDERAARLPPRPRRAVRPRSAYPQLRYAPGSRRLYRELSLRLAG